MYKLEIYLDKVDNCRSRRARELSDIKSRFTTNHETDPFSIRSKSTIVLAYANWEGFYNECVDCYLDLLSECQLAITETNWALLVGALSSDFESLRARNHSLESRRTFVTTLKARLESKFDQFDRTVVMSRSNLDFSKLKENLGLLGLDITPIQKSRIRLDKELVGWRHAIAHGNPPDLSAVNIADHLDFASELMLTVSDIFQEGMSMQTSACANHGRSSAP